ncbi:MAG: hypothetical protein QGD88_07650 [Anaerolineae bacterium]|nr:hypothetical protein [Anaerolineae bacterium]
MKKTIFLILILTLLLAACGGNDEAAQSGENGEQFDFRSQELPLSSTLAIGTLKLEETGQAVASDQAADLLPLWQVLKSLTESDSAAQEEIEAIIGQIQDTMTDEQMSTIEGMELTREDIFTNMQELGIEFSFGDRDGPPEGFGSGQGGGFPGDGFPGGGPGGGFRGQEFTPEERATVQARRAEGGGGFRNRLMTPLVEAVIEILQAKVQ